MTATFQVDANCNRGPELVYVDFNEILEFLRHRIIEYSFNFYFVCYFKLLLHVFSKFLVEGGGGGGGESQDGPPPIFMKHCIHTEYTSYIQYMLVYLA